MAFRSLHVPLRSRPTKPYIPRQTANTREPAHLPLHRRLLFPYDPPDKPVPPLINGDSSDLVPINERSVKHQSVWGFGLQADFSRLYHLIALLLRAYVLSWYPRFTRDRTLLPHIHQSILRPILAPILTEIHDDPERLCEFLFDLPTLLSLHVETYWSARAAVASGLVGQEGAKVTLAEEIGKAYHARLPLLSVELVCATTDEPGSGFYTLSPLYLTSLSDAVLRLYLPTSEYGSDVERLMTREVMGRSVLGSVGNKLGQPSFWWSIGLKYLGEPASASKSLKSALIESETSFSATTARLFTRLWTIVLLIWIIVTWILAAVPSAPPIEDKYRGIADSWLHLARAALGVDGRAGLERPPWARRLVWYSVEMVTGLLAPILDR